MESIFIDWEKTSDYPVLIPIQFYKKRGLQKVPLKLILFWTSPILGVAFFLLFWQRFILFCGKVLFQETIFHYSESLSFLDVENAFLRESDVSRQLGEEKINLRCKTCKFTAAKTTQILFLCALLEPRNTILMLMFFCRGLCGRIRCDSVGGAFWRLVLADIGETRGSFGFAPSGTTTQLYSLLLYILPGINIFKS